MSVVVSVVLTQVVVFLLVYGVTRYLRDNRGLTLKRIVFVLPFLFVVAGVASVLENNVEIHLIEYFSITQGALLGALKLEVG